MIFLLVSSARVSNALGSRTYLNAFIAVKGTVSLMDITILLNQTQVLLRGQMDVWLIKMSVKQTRQKMAKSYYVTGSGLFPIPEARANEVPALRKAFHDD